MESTVATGVRRAERIGDLVMTASLEDGMMDNGMEVEYINALTRDGVAVEVGVIAGKGDGLRLLDDALLLPFLGLLADEVGAGVKKRLK